MDVCTIADTLVGRVGEVNIRLQYSVREYYTAIAEKD